MANTLHQPYIFIAFLLAGGLSGAVYCVFWLLRRLLKKAALRHPEQRRKLTRIGMNLLLFLLDLIYVLLCGAVFFLTLLTFGQGEIKFYQLPAFFVSLIIALSLLARLTVVFRGKRLGVRGK